MLPVGPSRYKLYQSQTPGDMPARRLFPEGVDTRHCANKDAEPEWSRFGGSYTSIGERNECRGCWDLKDNIC